MSDDPIEGAWEDVLGDFDQESSHKKFLMLCSSLDRLAEAGKRYRAIKDDPDDERAEMAGKQVDRLLVIAMQNLDMLKSQPSNKKSAKTIATFIAFGVSSALIASALWSMLRTM